jgi:hypothetical protein
MYENNRTGSMHAVLFNDDPILIFNGFASSQAALAAMHDFETLYITDRDDFLWRLGAQTEPDDTREWESQWDAFLQRHQGGKYNPGFVTGCMVDLFTWA